jgi:hypothetical protein
MTKKARTRKDMVEALSPEEQKKALREMTFPYPLAEAFDAKIVHDEMSRRGDGKSVDLDHQKELIEKVSKKQAIDYILRSLEGDELNVPKPHFFKNIFGENRKRSYSPTAKEMRELLKGKEKKNDR